MNTAVLDTATFILSNQTLVSFVSFDGLVICLKRMMKEHVQRKRSHH